MESVEERQMLNHRARILIRSTIDRSNVRWNLEKTRYKWTWNYQSTWMVETRHHGRRIGHLRQKITVTVLFQLSDLSFGSPAFIDIDDALEQKASLCQKIHSYHKRKISTMNSSERETSRCSPLGVAPKRSRLSRRVSFHGITMRLICSSDSADELRLNDGERALSIYIVNNEQVSTWCHHHSISISLQFSMLQQGYDAAESVSPPIDLRYENRSIGTHT